MIFFLKKNKAKSLTIYIYKIYFYNILNIRTNCPFLSFLDINCLPLLKAFPFFGMKHECNHEKIHSFNLIFIKSDMIIE